MNSKNDAAQDPIVTYCIDHSYKLLPAQYQLIEIEARLQQPKKKPRGTAEVIQTCTCLMKQINAKHVLDIGTLAGATPFAWALAIPDNGRDNVITMDVSEEDYKMFGKKSVKEAGLSKKIDVRIQSALKTLNDLIAAGESGKFDFAFLDSDKTEYAQYYEKCLQLLRRGGFIAVDNALYSGRVTDDGCASCKAVDRVNKIISEDPRVNNVLLPIGDGLHLAFKI